MNRFHLLKGYGYLGLTILMLITLSLANLFVSYFSSGIMLILFGLGSMAIGVISLFALRNHVIAPLKTLSDISQNLAKGNLTSFHGKSHDGEPGAVIHNMNKLTANLEAASVFAANIGSGNFASLYEPVGQGDKLGLTLVSMRTKLQQIYQQDEKRNWTMEGLAKFSELLQSDFNNPKIYNSIISALVRYLGANQGGIFIVNHDDPAYPYMQLRGMYAWDRMKFIEKRISPGEGIIGQVWLEKEISHLREVPEKFVTISSGLGEANPRSIVVVPLLSNEEVFGIIEIATFKSFEEYQLHFLSKLGENIASTISGLQVSEQTKKLLVESQKQSEELRLQEEGMRQNMEELKATQEQLERREQEQVQEINRLNELHEQNAAKFKRLSLVADNTDNSVIITDQDIRIEYVNQGFTKLTGYTLHDVVGKKPGSFLQGEGTDQATVSRIRKHLNEQTAFYEEILNYDKSGKEYWISLAINPVFENGRLKNFISIQANVTETKMKALDFNYQLNAIGLSNAVIEFDIEGHIQYANATFLQTMGYTLEEIKGTHHRLFVFPEDIETDAYKNMWCDLRKGKSHVGEFKRRNKHGSTVWLKGTYTAILDLMGKPYKIIKFAQDITEQKIKTLDFEGQVNAVNNTMASVEFNVNGIIVSANDKFLETMGYSLEEIVGRHHRLFVDSDYAAHEEYALFWKELATGKSKSGEFQRVSKNGNPRWLSASYTPITDKEGNIYKIIKFAIDITAQKLTTLDNEGQINAIRRSNAVIEFDIDGNITYANELFLQTMKYQKDTEIINQHHKIFVYEHEQHSVEYQEFWGRLSRGEYFTGEFKRRRSDGSEVWIRGSYNPILDAKGKPYKVVKYAQVMEKKTV